VNANAAGIAVGAASHGVAVPADRDEGPVRERTPFTGDLSRPADRWRGCGIEPVAMASTGGSWRPLFQVPEARGFAVRPVDARPLERVPGRTSDVVDGRWPQHRHAVGLLAGASRPDDQAGVLRRSLRQRALPVGHVGQHVRHRQEAPVRMHLRLSVVPEDVTGATGLQSIRAVLAGERDPRRLAALRHGTCQRDAATIAAALRGDRRAEQRFALEQGVGLIDASRAKVAARDARLRAHRGRFADRGTGAPPPPGPRPRADRHGRGSDATAERDRGAGVDLTAIEGLGAHTGLRVLRETGPDMPRRPGAKPVGSWLGLAPDTRVRGGRLPSRRTRPTANRAATATRVAAQARHRSGSALGAFLRREAAHLGMPEAIAATADTRARRSYARLSTGDADVDPGRDSYERTSTARVVRTLARRADQLGYDLVTRRPAQPIATHAERGPGWCH
jgi:transposase